MTRAIRLGLRGTAPVGVIEDAPNSQQSVQVVDLPYWLFPPINWENFDQLAYVGLGAVGADVTILDYTVPIGRNGIIKKVANNFIGGGFQEGQGNIIWRILVDGAPPPGANSYNSILGSLGSPASPTEIAGFRVYENQRITVIAHNVAIVLAGQLVGARLVGWLYPRELEAADIWL